MDTSKNTASFESSFNRNQIFGSERNNVISQFNDQKNRGLNGSGHSNNYTTNNHRSKKNGNRNRNNNFIDYRCKICFDNVATILVLPCSHISTCISCATCIRYCPICRCNIKTLVKVYFS